MKTQETSAPDSLGAATGSATGVDWNLIARVMDAIHKGFEDTDSGNACARCTTRMLAEAVGLPLGPHRLLMEKEVRPLYRKLPNA